MSPYISTFAVKFGNCTLGACKDVGYTVFDHNETVAVGPFGNFTVSIFKKPSESLESVEIETQKSLESVEKITEKSFLSAVVLGAECNKVYKIDNGMCGELCLS